MSEPNSIVESFFSGLGPFLLYFIVGLVLVAAFISVYTFVTPHKEMELVKANKTSAAVSLSGAMIGFAIPIAYLISQSVSILDFFLWGIAAGLVQLAAFFSFRLLFPHISKRITEGETAAPLVLASMHVVVGIINAASMTY